MNKELTAERLRELLHYDPSTGVFRWIASRSKGIAGAIAGTPHCRGYVYIGIDGKQWFGHRLAWLYVHGRWPIAEIDHVNGVRNDNRIANLREAARQENLQNQRGPHSKNRTSRLLGVYLDKRDGTWYSQIKARGKVHNLGRFRTKELAHAAYLKAKAELHPFQTIVKD